MSLAQGSVKRPITTAMFFLIVILLGGIAFSRLPVDLMPELTYPTLTVRTTYPNVGPQEVEDLVTRPIEEAVAAIAGVEEITSNSSEGESSVRISFTWGTDLDAAADEVRSRIDRVRGQLPEEAETPSVFKFDLASFPIIFLGVSSSRLGPIDLREFTEERIERRLERVPGVASIDIRGGLRREVQVNLDRNKMLALGLSANQITRLLREDNLNRPAGKIEEGNLDVYLRTVGEYKAAPEIGATVVAVREGVPIYLRDIAEVKEGVQEVTSLVRINGEPGIRLSLNKQSGANTVQVANAVLTEVERINRDFPEVRVIPIIDTSQYIKQSISNVRSSALLGGVLAVVILLFFLRSGRSTLVIATAIPISVVGTFALVYFTGYTLNIMTFGGLALGVGMLVDNAIVVLENIFRKREAGLDPKTCAITGTQEVALAITASTLTTIAVFLPILFMEGASGVMYKQLAVVVSFSLFASLAVALTLIPVLSSRLLARGDAHPHARWQPLERFYGRSERFLVGMEDRYRNALLWALAHRSQVLLGSLALFVASLLVTPFLGSELMPKTDEGEVRINAEMAVGTKLDVMDRTFRQIEEIARREVPETQNMLANVGGGGGWQASGGHTGDIRLSLVSQSERDRSSEEIANDLRRELAGIPGVKIRAREGSGLFILNMAFGGGEEGLTVEVRGYDLEAGHRLAEQVQQALSGIAGVTDVRIGRDAGRPERVIRIDRDRIARLGLSMNEVAEIIETNLAGSRATVLRRAGREYDIVVRLAEPQRNLLADVEKVSLVSASGETVPLRSVVDVTFAKGPVIIDRKDQERVINVTANVADRDLGSVAADAQEALRALQVPDGLALVLGGEYEEQQKAKTQLVVALILAIVLVYMVMAAQFENLWDPFVVMFSIPMAAVGVFFTMWLTGTTFNVQSYIGMVMLAGIVVNNAIVLVDYTNLMRRDYGMSLLEAVVESGRRRLRPILMTTATTVLGLVPLAIGLGEGSEVQASMARVVVGGLTVSTLVTLILVPVIYTGLAEWQLRRADRRVKALDEARAAAGEGLEPAS
ncbi:MAG TPA: efflux RND transporter permease subunit [Thermoanaerobaculia bacterium]|nr:efflux RND transporter permease subunit [Thermoanaerobaculia bacterium]